MIPTYVGNTFFFKFIFGLLQHFVINQSTTLCYFKNIPHFITFRLFDLADIYKRKDEIHDCTNRLMCHFEVV